LIIHIKILICISDTNLFLPFINIYLLNKLYIKKILLFVDIFLILYIYFLRLLNGLYK